MAKRNITAQAKTNGRVSKEEFYRVAEQTPRSQKVAQLQKFNPKFVDEPGVDLDGILYGLHLMCTSPCV